MFSMEVLCDLAFCACPKTFQRQQCQSVKASECVFLISTTPCRSSISYRFLTDSPY
jgi:hypothetical protein